MLHTGQTIDLDLTDYALTKSHSEAVQLNRMRRDFDDAIAQTPYEQACDAFEYGNCGHVMRGQHFVAVTEADCRQKPKTVIGFDVGSRPASTVTATYRHGRLESISESAPVSQEAWDGLRTRLADSTTAANGAAPIAQTSDEQGWTNTDGNTKTGPAMRSGDVMNGWSNTDSAYWRRGVNGKATSAYDIVAYKLKPEYAQQPADTWKDGPPPVPGAYRVRDYFRREEIRDYEYNAHWNGSQWTGGNFDDQPLPTHSDTHDLALKEWQWLRLIKPDTPPAAKEDTRPALAWRHGGDIPSDEKKSGMWFVLMIGNEPSTARPASHWSFDFSKYLRAPEGVTEGAAFDPAMYREV